MPRPNWAISSRWISLVPPPKVRVVAERNSYSRSPSNSVAAEPLRIEPLAPTIAASLRRISMADSEPNTLVVELSATLMRSSSRSAAMRMLIRRIASRRA
ncbi:hypothetical protein D3C76_1050670 [compost metagenome]